MEGKCDMLDLQILKELRQDAKQSYRQLAEKLKIHPNTLMQRIKKLERDKIITGYQASINYTKLGYDYHGIAMLRTKKASTDKDIWQFKDIINLPQVQALYATTGVYDAVAIVRVKEREEMVKILKTIQESPIVYKSNTQIVLETFKHPSEYNPF